MTLIVVLVAATTVKTVVLAQLHAHPLLQPVGGLDTEVYVRLARRAAGGDWMLGPDPYFVSPLYVYFLAVILKVTGSLLAARVAQITLGTLAVGLVFAAARRLYGAVAAATAAVLAAATGAFTFYEVVLLQSALDPFLTALGLALLARALETDRAGDFALVGLAIGVHALNRPNVLLWLATLAALLAFTRGRRRAAVVVLLGGLAAVAPVTLRNRAVSGEWILVSSHGGLNFYIGNNETADGAYHSVAGITPQIQGQAEDARRVAEAAAGRPLSVAETSRYFSGRAWEWIRRQPGRALILFVRKLAYTLNQTDLPLNYSFAYYRDDEGTALRLLPVGPWLLVPLGLLGLVAAPSRSGGRDAWTWKAFAPVYAVSVAAFFVAGRYRLPLLVSLCVAAGAGATHLLTLAREGKRKALGYAAVGMAVVALFASWDFRLDDGRAAETTEMVVALIDRGRIDEARALIGRAAGEAAETVAVDLARANNALAEAREARGVALFQLGRLEAAAEELEVACALDPARASAQLNLAVVRAEQGRYEEARTRVDAALRLRPDYPQARGLRAALDRMARPQRGR